MHHTLVSIQFKDTHQYLNHLNNHNLLAFDVIPLQLKNLSKNKRRRRRKKWNETRGKKCYSSNNRRHTILSLNINTGPSKENNPVPEPMFHSVASTKTSFSKYFQIIVHCLIQFTSYISCCIKIFMVASRTYLGVVFWPMDVGMYPVGLPPVHNINLGLLTQEDWKSYMKCQTEFRTIHDKVICKMHG